MSGKKLRKWLLAVLSGLFSIALLVLAAASLILAKPDPAQTEKPDESSHPLAASPALDIRDETELYRLVTSFPAPVMSFMSGSGMVFVSAVSSDAATPHGFARRAALYWQTEDGQPVILQSIFPAEALSLLDEGYHFSAAAGPTLFGVRSVRMEKEGTVRIHTASDEALYVLTVPESLGDRISEICRSLQLFTVNEEAAESAP